MIDSKVLDHDYDEERIGFAEPPNAEIKPLTLYEKLSLAI